MEIDKVIANENENPKGWLNMPMWLELTKPVNDSKAPIVAMMIMEEFTKQRGTPVKGDVFTLARIIRHYAKTAEDLAAIEEMRPELLIFFDQDQDGCLTPKPGLIELKDPYETEDDDDE